MRPNNPNRRLRHLKLVDPATGAEAASPSRAPSRPHRDHSTQNLLKAALATPSDVTLWRNVFDAALRENNFELARRASKALGEDGVVLDADIALAEGKPAHAILVLKDRPDIESRLRLAWALFCMEQLESAATIWLMTGREDESLLGRTLSALVKNARLAEVLTNLRKLSDSESRYVSAAAGRLLAEYHAGQGDSAKAVSWGRRAEWMMPHDVSLKRLLARAYATSGNKEAAALRWKEVLVLAAEDAEAHEALGRGAYERKEVDAAVDHFVQALATDPFRGELRILLGDIAKERGKEDEAVEHWETAARLNTQDKVALDRLAEHAWDRGDVDDALAFYLRLQKLGFPPEEEEEHLEMIGYLYSEVLLGGDNARLKEAGAFFADAIKKFTSNPFLRIYDARRLIAQENLADARKLIEGVLKQNPLMPEAVFEMGNLLVEDGNFAKGIAMLHRAETLDSDPFYKKELGRNYLHAEDWVQAEKWLKKALSSGVEDEELLLALHVAVYQQGKYSLCENLLRRALTIFPDNMQALTYLSEILMLLGRPEESLAILKTVKEISITVDEFDEGKGAAEMVVDPPGCVDWLLGFALFFTGDYRPAEKHWAAAHKLSPDLGAWFQGLRDAVLARLASDKKLAKRFNHVEFFTQTESRK